MITKSQAAKYRKKKKKIYCRTKKLNACPQKQGFCTKITTTSPKKPNSGVRKIAKIKLSTKVFIRASIPGQGHKLQKFSHVLVRGGRVRDIPGIHYKLIKGVLDFSSDEFKLRRKSRSKYGLKKLKSKNKIIKTSQKI